MSTMMVRAPRRAVSPRLLLAGIAAVVVLAVPTHADAQSRFPQARGWVNDFAGIMDAAKVQGLNAMLGNLKRATGTDVVVVTLPEVPQGDVKTAATELFQEWGIGTRGTDKGVLMLVSVNDRRVEIEVGYGVEGILPDAKAGRILDQFVVPAFTQGDYTSGIVAGTAAIAQIVADDAGVDLARLGAHVSPVSTMPRQRIGPLGMLLNLIVLVLMGMLFIRHPFLFLMFMGMAGRGYGFGGGGFGGGSFGGFGGGMSGGGGAGRGW